MKSQHRLSSQISPSHARQVALYAAASDNVAARVAYITPKKSAVYELENPQEHLNALVKVGQVMQRFLAISDDPHELAGLVCPNYENFFWSSPATRQAGFETYGY